MKSLRACAQLCSLLLLLLAGCSSRDDNHAASAECLVVAAAPVVNRANTISNLLPASAPRAEGQRLFLQATHGAELNASWPPAEFMLALMQNEPEVFGSQFAAFGFIADPDDEFPVGFKRGSLDPSRVHETCALCHVGYLPDGRLWLGQPNGELDIGRFRVAVNQRWIAAGNASLMSELEISKAQALGPGRTNAESGMYPDVVPADFPPYFRLGQLAHLNYLGTGLETRTEVYFSLFTFGAGNPDVAGGSIPFPDQSTVLGPLVEFMATIEPPAQDGLDAQQIEAGRSVFSAAGCVGCHDTDAPANNPIVPHAQELGVAEFEPGESADHPVGTIDTSPLHRQLMSGDNIDAGRNALIDFIVDNNIKVTYSSGYRSPSLAGLWATAPYLHNGSVPCLEQLLVPSAQRQRQFMRSEFVVDKSQPGNDNRGHEFGLDLSADEKVALLAFLQSL